MKGERGGGDTRWAIATFICREGGGETDLPPRWAVRILLCFSTSSLALIVLVFTCVLYVQSRCDQENNFLVVCETFACRTTPAHYQLLTTYNMKTMSSITIATNQKTIPGADLQTGREDGKHDDPRKTHDESAGAAERKDSASPVAKHPLQESTTIEHANRRFLKTIVDHWNERENASFIQDLTPVMEDYLKTRGRG